MPTLYESLVVVHILAAVVWIGGGFTMQILAARARRSDEPGAMAAVLGDIEFIGMRVLMPTSLVLVGAGVWAVMEGPWDFSQGWISAGLAMWLFSAALGASFLGPEAGRIRGLIAQHGRDNAAVRARIDRVFLVARVELVALVAVVFIMSTKPWL